MSASINIHRPQLNRMRVDILKRSDNTAVFEFYNETQTISATLFFDNIDELYDFITKALVLADEKRGELHLANGGIVNV